MPATGAALTGALRSERARESVTRRGIQLVAEEGVAKGLTDAALQGAMTARLPGSRCPKQGRLRGVRHMAVPDLLAV
jgi:hypothetical protein